MGKDEYFAAGGALKLKGVKPTGITKKKKKKKAAATAATEATNSSKGTTPDPSSSSAVITEKNSLLSHEQHQAGEDNDDNDDDNPYHGKTEAERRFEARHRILLEQRQAKKGVKTHKERVEEYNKYLASLSEHHDMPRIGPG